VCRGDRLEFLFVLALGTGLRQGEILGLAWEDVTPEGVSVRKELARIDGKYQRVEPKTPASRRFVPFSGSVAAGLERHRARVIADGFVPTRTGPVFTNTTGGALNGSWLTHRFYDLLAEAGIDRLPFRNLRTTFASRLYDAGVPDHTIAQLMGHTRTHTTRRNYIARTPEQAVAAIERLVAAG
jgi:integrase